MAAPLVADHPLRAFVETLAWDVVKQREAMERAARLAPDGLELHAAHLLSRFSQFHAKSANPILQTIQEHGDGLARDAALARIRTAPRLCSLTIRRQFCPGAGPGTRWVARERSRVAP